MDSIISTAPSAIPSESGVTVSHSRPATWCEALEKRADAPRVAVIAVAGLPGAGKTTCYERLRQHYATTRTLVFAGGTDELLTPSEIEALDRLTKKVDLQTRSAALADIQEIYLRAQRRRFTSLSVSTESSGIIILDRGVEDSFFYQDMFSSMGALAQDGLLEEFSDLISFTSTGIVYLDAPIDTVRTRFRTRAFLEGRPADDARFDLIEDTHLAWYIKCARSIEVINTENAEVKDVFERVLEVVNRLVELIQVSHRGEPGCP